jgi:methyltransferase family protein
MNLSKYDFTRTPSHWKYDWCVDSLHRTALFEMAMCCTGNVVEIGCFRGYSSAAFVEAINQGADIHAHLVDIKVTDELRRVAGMCKFPERVTIHETHATEFRITDAPVALFWVDGDHNFAACQDVLNAIVSDAQIIAMHDTNAHPEGFAECEGAYVAANALKAWPARRFLEDTKRREGLWTHQGFLASFSPSAPQKAYDACKAALDSPHNSAA